MNEIKLFCIPYAGGSALIYKKWSNWLHRDIELIPVELAGRGRRISERLYRDVGDMVQDVHHSIRPHLGEGPYAIFGHSMGAMIAYELARKIAKEGLPAPSCIFFSGRAAPGVYRDDKKNYSGMSAEQFREEVISLGGTPPEFFDHPELLDIFLPMLRNDFRMSETELYPDGEPEGLDYDIHVLIGKEEDLNAEQCDGWRRRSTRSCWLRYFPGGHFFINECTEDVVRHVNQTILHNHKRSFTLNDSPC